MNTEAHQTFSDSVPFFFTLSVSSTVLCILPVAAENEHVSGELLINTFLIMDFRWFISMAWVDIQMDQNYSRKIIEKQMSSSAELSCG